MAKSSNKKTTSSPQKKKKKKAPKRNYKQLVISTLIILAIIAFILPDIMPLFTGGGGARRAAPSNNNTQPSTAMVEPTFTKEGELSLISNETGEVIKKLDIEKAENDQERAIGMMFRKSMPDSRGMLFLFDEAKPQSFWMKNTLIPLDIIYVDENRVINTIHSNTIPHSETSLPSNGNAKYVLEVRGGFCQDFGVKVGDQLEWE